MPAKRVRMIAGPNGSGKSNLYKLLSTQVRSLGVFINADKIEKELREKKILNLTYYNLSISDEELKTFLKSHALIHQLGNVILTELKIENNILTLTNPDIIEDKKRSSYFAAVIAEFLREKSLQNENSFTFETVMSHPSKIQFLERAKKLGFRTYLYYVSLESPELNVFRVNLRVKKGGHEVPEGKIISRYYKSLDLLMDAVEVSDRAYFFDNSTDSQELIAEMDDEGKLELFKEEIPGWFNKYLIEKL